MFPLPVRSITFYQIKHFLSVADNQSFSKAARQCHVTQSAISQQIVSLEEALGCKLVERENQKARLTGAGKLVYNELSGVMISLENAFVTMEKLVIFNGEDHKKTGYDQLRIGYNGGWEQMILPEMLSRFSAEYKYEDCRPLFLYPSMMMHSLESGVVDLLFSTSANTSSNEKPASMVVARSPICLIVPKDHMLAQREEVSLDELVTETFVRFESRGQDRNVNKLFNNVLRTHTDRLPVYATEMNNAVLAVSSGLGISLCIADCSRYLTQDNIRFIKLKDDLPPIEIRAYWRKENRNPVLLKFLEMLQNQLS